MSSLRVVITDSNLPARAVEEGVLVPAGFEVVRAECKSESDVIEAAREADAIIVQWATISDAVLSQLDRCQLVSRLGIGLDIIDIDAATRHGIAVSNTPDYCLEEVAAHTIALALSVTRGVPSLEASLRRGEWAVVANAPRVVRPSSATFAVIGFGRIGRRVARIASALGYDVVVHDRFVDPTEVAAAGFRQASFEEAITGAAVVALHVPLTAETSRLIDGPALELIGRDGFLVNTSRGELIDEVALVRALEEETIAGAALDVFEREPLSAESPLRTAPRLLLTPHAAWYSTAALDELPRHAAEHVVAFFAGEPPRSIVNPGYAAVRDSLDGSPS